MNKYRISINEVTEFDEVETKYETKDGKRTYSSYDLEKGTFKTVNVPTGARIIKSREVYAQEFDSDDLSAVIKAVNGIK